jgi:two-component system nitrogen regulation response regulator GlnG
VSAVASTLVGGLVGGAPVGEKSASASASAEAWLDDLEREARALLEKGHTQVWDDLTRLFEGRLIQTALAITKGRRIEAAHKLGIGRNTITRKIQELGLD